MSAPLSVMGVAKGQLISKYFLSVFTFFQKTNKNKSASSKVEFVCSFFWKKRWLEKIILNLSVSILMLNQAASDPPQFLASANCLFYSTAMRCPAGNTFGCEYFAGIQSWWVSGRSLAAGKSLTDHTLHI